MSVSSYQGQTAFGLDDLPPFAEESYSSIYPGSELEMDSSYKSHLGVPLYYTGHPFLGSPRALDEYVGRRMLTFPADVDHDHSLPFQFDPINSINPGDAFLPHTQPSPPLAPSPLSDASDLYEFSAPSSVMTNKSVPLPQEDEYVPSEPESDDGSEYTPSSRAAPRGGQGSRQSTAGGRKGKSSKANPKATRKTPYQKSKKARQSPPSRVYQSSGETAALMQAALTDNEIAESLQWACPESVCNYRMGTKARMPDFRRHLRAHLRDQNRAAGTGHFCHGVQIEELNNLTVLQLNAIRRHHGEGIILNGEQWVGGCLQSFSRGDALTRHVKSKANPCIGKISGQLVVEHVLDF